MVVEVRLRLVMLFFVVSGRIGVVMFNVLEVLFVVLVVVMLMS